MISFMEDSRAALVNLSNLKLLWYRFSAPYNIWDFYFHCKAGYNEPVNVKILAQFSFFGIKSSITEFPKLHRDRWEIAKLISSRKNDDGQ